MFNQQFLDKYNLSQMSQTEKLQVAEMTQLFSRKLLL